MRDENVVLRLEGICKEFPGVKALQNVEFTLHKGEIHALMGENGAGKSTLMKMLFGLEQPTSGEIWVHGEKLTLSSPTVAISHGIGMVHQHFMLIQPFTVTENIILGMEPTKGLTIDKETAREKVMELSERYGMKVDPDAKVEDISVGMQQRVEILKVLYRGAETLILDEPTAALDPIAEAEIYEQFSQMTAGKTAVYISHRMSSCKFCDRIVVFADDTIKENGTHEQLVGIDGGIYAGMFAEQAKYYAEG